MDFIKKSRQLAECLEEAKTDDIFDIVNEDMIKEIINIHGSEFDLYLKGLFYRDFTLDKLPL